MKLSKLLLSTILTLSLSMTAFADESKPWPVLIESRQGNNTYYITQTMPLSAFTSTLYPINNYIVMSTSLDKTQKTKVRYIGQISGLKVYDLIYTLDDSYYKYLKVIVLEKAPHQYIPVFYLFIETGYFLKPLSNSFIILDKNLIANEQLMTGSGGESDCFYLYVPPDIAKNKNAIPKIVNWEIIYDLLKKKLPKDYYAPTGNAFNMNTLHFHSCVTKTDAHCFYDKSYDTLDMQFKLDDGELKLVSFEYHNLQQPQL